MLTSQVRCCLKRFCCSHLVFPSNISQKRAEPVMSWGVLASAPDTAGVGGWRRGVRGNASLLLKHFISADATLTIAFNAVLVQP